MPGRKTRKTKQLPLNKNVTKRLMAISLEVDKYIYKHKPISATQAHSYLHEVAEYKVLCNSDERSLQVIEKLTRCMKSIIKELTSKNQECSKESESLFANNINNGFIAVSPVYSLADEDKTQASDLIYDDDDNLNNINDVEDNIASDVTVTVPPNIILPINTLMVTDVAQTQAELSDEHALASGTLKTCTQDQNANNENEDIIIDLTQIDEEFDKHNDDMCSQSILNNVDIPHTYINTNVSDNPCGQDMAEFDKEIANILQDKEEATVQTRETIQSLPSIMKPKRSDTNILVTKPAKSLKIQNFIPEISKGNKKKNVSIEIKNIRKTSKIYKTKGAKQNTRSNNDNANSNIAQPIEKNVLVSNFGTQTCDESVKSKPTQSKNNKPNKKALKRSKKCVTDDLSWIENIKYIREINIEENDSKLNYLNDSFWDNCYLPYNWNDGEFE